MRPDTRAWEEGEMVLLQLAVPGSRRKVSTSRGDWGG